MECWWYWYSYSVSFSGSDVNATNLTNVTIIVIYAYSMAAVAGLYGFGDDSRTVAARFLRTVNRDSSAETYVFELFYYSRTATLLLFHVLISRKCGYQRTNLPVILTTRHAGPPLLVFTTYKV